MNAEKFWFGWLKIAAALCTLFGVFMALFNQSGMFNFLNNLIVNSFYSSNSNVSIIAPLQAWLIGILGATMAGWGIMMLYLIKHPLQNKERWAWNAIFISMIVWFTIDSFISFHYGANFNLLINALLFLQFLAPLLVIRSSMVKIHKNETL